MMSLFFLSVWVSPADATPAGDAIEWVRNLCSNATLQGMCDANACDSDQVDDGWGCSKECCVEHFFTPDTSGWTGWLCWGSCLDRVTCGCQAGEGTSPSGNLFDPPMTQTASTAPGFEGTPDLTFEAGFPLPAGGLAAGSPRVRAFQVTGAPADGLLSCSSWDDDAGAYAGWAAPLMPDMVLLDGSIWVTLEWEAGALPDDPTTLPDMTCRYLHAATGTKAEFVVQWVASDAG